MSFDIYASFFLEPLNLEPQKNFSLLSFVICHLPFAICHQSLVLTIKKTYRHYELCIMNY